MNIWDKKYNDIIMEKRFFNVESRVESTEDGKTIIRGHASVYESRSEFMGFYEYIAKGAFNEELINSSDVRALINHDPNLVMARSKFGEGTLNLTADEKGLAYEYELPDLSYARDLAVNLKNGNITQSSFAFTIAKDGDTWDTDEDGNDVRTINTIGKLFDISSVAFPAYADADSVVASRSHSMYKEKIKTKEEETDLVMRSLAKLKITINNLKTKK